MATTADPPKVVIYGVGQFGSITARIALKKGYTIVGAVNRAGDKIGQDLGQLIGLERILGIPVEDCEHADYRAMNADVAIETTSDVLEDAYPGYERLLGAGINVISLAAQANYPQAANSVVAQKIDAVAKANNASFTGTSIWDMSRIWMGIVATGPCTEISAIHHTSITNMMNAGVHALQHVGIGCTQDDYVQLRQRHDMSGMYSLNVQHVLHHIGYQVSKVNEYIEPVLFDVPIDCPPLKRAIEPGGVAGSRYVSEISTVEGVSATMHHELRLFLPDEKEYTEWVVDGHPGCTVRTDRRDSQYAVSSSMINRIPDVMAAAPGIRLLSELGPLKHSALLATP